MVAFVSEMVFFDCDFYATHDTNGKTRRGIKFFLKRLGAVVDYQLDKVNLAAEPELADVEPLITERSGIILSRVGQGAYRKSIINRWESKCAVTEFADPRILIASHIHAWADATDDQRLDSNNGILLSPNYDALFDKHLITFDNSGTIVLSTTISVEEYKKVGISGKERITKFNNENIFYLEQHQQLFGG